jgi:8-oxo-dGTP diphosphatase
MSLLNRSVAGIAVKGNPCPAAQVRLFVAKRRAGGDLGGKWEFPGGKVEPGESDEDALRREYLEEFGLAVQTGEALANSEFAHNEKIYTLAAWRVYFDEAALDRITLAEHTQWQWASLADIEKLDFAGSDRALFPALYSYFEKQTRIQ